MRRTKPVVIIEGSGQTEALHTLADQARIEEEVEDMMGGGVEIVSARISVRWATRATRELPVTQAIDAEVKMKEANKTAKVSSSRQ